MNVLDLRRLTAPLIAICLALAVVVATLPTTSAQANKKFGFDAGFGPGFDSGFGGTPYVIESSYQIEKATGIGSISIKMTLDGDNHIYSQTQDGGPMATKIELLGDENQLLGPFLPNEDPLITRDEEIYPGVEIKEFHNEVTWIAKVSVNETLRGKPLAVKFSGQVCDVACIPVDEELKVDFDGYLEPKAAPGIFFAEGTHVKWRIEFSKVEVQPGETFDLQLMADVVDGYHIYPIDMNSTETNNLTLISFLQKSRMLFGAPKASSEAEAHTVIEGEPDVIYHPGDVVWKIPVKVPKDAAPGIYGIEGLVGYQSCDDAACDFPKGLRFSGDVQVGQLDGAKIPLSKSLSITEAKYSRVVESDVTGWVDELSKSYAALPILDLLKNFGFALIGGFILNFMPCVLPVIGLKVMAFLQEGDGSRRRFVALNMWYIAGIMAVVMAIAVTTIGFRAAGSSLIWGEQYGSYPFRIGMLSLITAMALSFLGVWEIPIPGFATSSKSGEMMTKEGASGAFFKGILTTVLAVPCSGPFLGAVFALSLSQPSWVILLMFFGVALGLSLPYIVISIFPSALSILPKPGPWMDTLKQVLAFPLLLTAVYFIAQFPADYRIAAIVLMIVVWFCCWLIGQVPPYAERSTKFQAWAGSLAVGILGGYIGFYLCGPREEILQWEIYSEARLLELQDQGKTVMIDFTAEWCPNCKYNLRTAIDTKKVGEFVEASDIVPMIADFTDRPAHIKQKLEELKSASIPVLAIYPGAPQSEPIVLRDVVIESQVITALNDALTSSAAEDETIETVSMEPPKPIGVR
jgi:thiol:disulfide interchange protein